MQLITYASTSMDEIHSNRKSNRAATMLCFTHILDAESVGSIVEGGKVVGGTVVVSSVGWMVDGDRVLGGIVVVGMVDDGSVDGDAVGGDAVDVGSIDGGSVDGGTVGG